MHDFELLVVADGSTDDSVACIAAVADPRLRLLRRPHTGISATMNAGLTAARGEYVARLDSDDLWRPELLAVLVPLLDARPDAAAVSGRREEVCDASHEATAESSSFATSAARTVAPISANRRCASRSWRVASSPFSRASSARSMQRKDW